jgi:hypothetical protein
MKTDDELRELLRQYTEVNDGYLEALSRKDTKILQQNLRIDELEGLVEKLKNTMFSDVPKGGEGSE